MIYLIGVDHIVQHDRSHKETKRFIPYLEDKIISLGIKFVGEEWNEDAEMIGIFKTTTVQDIARDYKVKHEFCDPRKGETENRSFAVREKFWYKKILNRVDDEMIFICGSEHLPSFSKFLKSKGVYVKILPEIFDNIE